MGAELLQNLITVSVGTSLLIAVLLAITPLLRRRYPAKWRYAAWLLLAVRLLIPLNVPLPGPAAVAIPLPSSASSAPLAQVDPQTGYPTVEAEEPTAGSIPAGESVTLETPELTPAPQPVLQLTLWQVLGVVWLTGCVVFVALHTLSYRYFLAALRRSAHQPVPRHIRETLWELGVDMGVCNLPEVIITEQTAAPVLLGLSHPRLLLPHDRYSRQEFAFILRHELVHYRRRDLWYKLVILAANAVHWFNPLVWVMAAQAGKDIELACDDAVVRELDDDARARYGDTILAALPRTRRLEPVLSTHFGSTKKNMKGRLHNLFDFSAKRRGVAALCTVAVCAGVLAGTVTFTFAADKNAAITGANPEREITGIMSVSIDAIAPDQAICIGRLDLRSDRRYLPNIEAASGRGLLFGLHTRPDITDTSDPSVAFDNAFAGSTGSLVGNSFVGDDSGSYYVYIGSSGGGRLTGISGSIVIEPYSPQPAPEDTPDIATETVAASAADTDADPFLQWMRTSYYIDRYSPERTALQAAGTALLAEHDTDGMSWSALSWDFDTLARFYDLDSDLLTINSYDLFYSVLRGGGQSYGYSVFRFENGAPRMYSLNTATAAHDLDVVMGTVRPLLEQSGFHIATTSAVRVRVDRGRRGAEITATGRVYEAIRFQDTDGSDALYLLQVPSTDSTYQAGQLVMTEEFRGRPSSALPTTAFPVSAASIPGGGIVRLGQIAVTGSDMRYDVSVTSGSGLFVSLSKDGAITSNTPKAWRYYSQTDSSRTNLTDWNNVQPDTYYVYVGSAGSALTSVSGEIAFTGSVLDTTPAGGLASAPEPAPTSVADSAIPRQSGSGVQKVNLYGLGEGVADSALNDYDRECITIMEYSGTWGSNVERLLPNMTPGGVEKAVAIYLEKHLFPRITPPESARQVRSTVQNALGYLSADARQVAEDIIASFE